MEWMSWIVFALIALAIVGSGYFRKHALDRLLMKIHQAGYQDRDEQAFLLYVNSPMAKMLVNEVTRQFMKLNYYIHTNNHEQVVKLTTKMLAMRMDGKTRQAFYLTSMAYFAQKQDKDMCRLILDTAKKTYENTRKPEESMVLFDLQLTYDIYIGHDVSKIKGVEHLIEVTEDPAMKATYLYRLAILHKANQQMDKARFDLNAALKLVSSDQERIMIQSILDNDLQTLQ